MIQSRWNQFSRMWYLIGQHALVQIRAEHTISCRRCHQHFDAYSSESMQGHDICAWTLCVDGRWMLRAGYGSSYDMKEFWFIDQFPTETVDGICDFCIMRMLKDGIIIDSGLETAL